jgi:hypothetical protein
MAAAGVIGILVGEWRQDEWFRFYGYGYGEGHRQMRFEPSENFRFSVDERGRPSRRIFNTILTVANNYSRAPHVPR